MLSKVSYALKKISQHLKRILEYYRLTIRQYLFFDKRCRLLAFSFLETRTEWERHQIAEYQKIYKEHHEKYDIFSFYRMYFSRIGEAIPRMADIFDDLTNGRIKGERENVCNVFTAGTPISNYKLFEMFGRKVNIVSKDTIGYWEYVSRKHPEKIDLKHFMKYNDRQIRRYIWEKGDCMLNFSDEEIAEAEEKMKNMGIDKGFVCIHSRDDEYLKYHVNGTDNTHEYRNCSIQNYLGIADYIKEQGMQMVRVGNVVADKIDNEGCIDYANLYREELLDLYLQYKCKFFIGNSAGLFIVSSIFGTPKALANMVPLCMGYSSIPFLEEDRFIPKKYWSEKENRFLTFSEMFDIDKYANFETQKYIQNGIRTVENTSDEILDLVIEMNQRLDGIYVESDDDTNLQIEYQELLNDWCRKNSINICESNPCKIGTKYLRDNKFLLKK